MALTDEQGNFNVSMPVAPIGYGGGYGGGYTMPVMPYSNGCGNGFGGDWGSLIVLFLIAALFGGNGFGFGGGYGGGLSYDFPWLLNGQNGINNNTSDGFRNLETQNQLTAVQSDLGDIQTQLCNGFAGVNATVNGGFANAETAANARQIANMQQAFNSQVAVTGAITDLASQQAQCCCENRLATCQTQNIIQNEANATRFADANNTRDLLVNQTANTQAILDKLCQLELDAKNDKISDLERQLTMANLAASQTAQTARLIDNNNAQTVALEQYLNPVPVPAYIVQNPNCCQNNNYGCGCGGNF